MARQLALDAPAGERLYGGLVVLRLLAHPRSPEHPEDGAAFQQYKIERQFWNLSGGKSDDEVAALPGERAQRRLAVAPAHWIEYDVDAVLAAESLERVPQLLPFIVHQLMRPVCAGKGELVVGRGAGDHARAHLASNLDSGKPDAAGSPEHGQSLARAHQRPVLERMVSRAIGDGQRCSAIEIEIGRQPDDVVGGDRRAFARGVKIGVAHDAVAGLECINSRADAFDHARELAARREWKRRLGLVLAGDDERLETIHDDPRP